jgi:hypothetical protein
MRALALLLANLLLVGCFVQSREEATQLELTVGSLPPGRGPTASFAPWDSQGLFHLEDYPPGFPKLVKVSVETQDYTLTTGTWPDPQLGVGEGEKPGGEVSLTLEVPAGAGRRLSALGFVIINGEVFPFHEDQPLALDLQAGNTTEATLNMVPHPVGTVEITTRCEEGNLLPWQPTEVALVDAKAFVLQPAAQLQVDEFSGSLTAVFQRVPVGRPHWVRLTVSNGTLFTYIDKRTPTFTVSNQAELQPVTVAIPCKDL